MEKSYQGTIPLREWRELLSDMKTRHWKAALENPACPVLAKKRKWFTDTAKANFYRQLDFNRDDRFLDIGAGSGVISAEMSRHCARGVALDFAEETSRFMKIRFRQDDLGNLSVVRADALKLPFASRSFGLVILNGVLEWVAAYTTGQSCRSVQIGFLQEARRCLRPGGKIAIAIENRWDLDHFFGASPHGEPAFVAVMPRILARAVHYLRRNQDYRTYIYGCSGYRRILKTAGFRSSRIYLAVPDYYSPRRADEFTPKNIGIIYRERQAQYQRKKMLIERVLHGLGLLGYFLPAFYITAENPGR